MQPHSNRQSKVAALLRVLATLIYAFLLARSCCSRGATSEGRFFRGRGDVEYLRLLDTARRMSRGSGVPELVHALMPTGTAWSRVRRGRLVDSKQLRHDLIVRCRSSRNRFVTFLKTRRISRLTRWATANGVGAAPPFKLGRARRLPLRRGTSGLDRLLGRAMPHAPA